MAETLGFPVPLPQRFRPLSITCPRFLTTCGEAALPLDQRGHVRLAVLLAEDQQVGLPVPERLATRDLGRPVLDPALARDGGAARPAAVAAPAPPPGLGQVAVEAVLAALRAVEPTMTAPA